MNRKPALETVGTLAANFCFGSIERRWTTVGVIAGVVFSFFIGGIGVAMGGSAFALWGWLFFGAIFGLIGNRIGVGRQHRSGQT